MIKFRLLYDKDEGNAWLNSMAQEGWAVTGFFAGFYVFDSCEKGAYSYQVDFTDRLFSVSNDYREFMQEMGIEIVCQWGFWVLLRKPASEGEFKLYTDVDSQIEQYSKIRTMLKIVAVIEIICFYSELLAAANGFYFGYVFALPLGALVVIIANAAFKTSNIIEELKERKAGITSEKASKQRRFSLLIPAGMLLNSFALLISNPTAIYLVYLKNSLHILAIILMAAGVFLTTRRRK